MHLTAAQASAAATGTPTAPQPRLVRAAHEFEAQMMGAYEAAESG